MTGVPSGAVAEGSMGGGMEMMGGMARWVLSMLREMLAGAVIMREVSEMLFSRCLVGSICT